MPDPADRRSKRVLDPHERIAEAGRDDVRTMLIGTLGCNLAWGLIDGVLYLMGCLAERGRGLLTLRAVRQAADPAQAQRLIADALPPVVASLLQETELASLHRRLLELPAPPQRVHLSRRDWSGALGVLLLGVLLVGLTLALGG